MLLTYIITYFKSNKNSFNQLIKNKTFFFMFNYIQLVKN